jgi:hypothetical protein
MSKRAVWIAEGILGAIGIIGLFTGYQEIAMACVVGIAATMDKLVER